MPSEYRNRINLLRSRIAESDAAALVVAHLPNIRYLSGFTGSAAILIVETGSATLFTDGRYAVQAPQEVKPAGVRVTIPQGSVLKATGAYLASLQRHQRSISVAYDPAQVTVLQHKDF